MEDQVCSQEPETLYIIRSKSCIALRVHCEEVDCSIGDKKWSKTLD